MIKNIVVFFLFTVALVGAQVPRVALPPPGPSRYYIHVVNGLSKLGLLVHCQSKDYDLGYHVCLIMEMITNGTSRLTFGEQPSIGANWRCHMYMSLLKAFGLKRSTYGSVIGANMEL